MKEKGKENKGKRVGKKKSQDSKKCINPRGKLVAV